MKLKCINHGGIKCIDGCSCWCHKEKQEDLKFIYLVKESGELLVAFDDYDKAKKTVEEIGSGNIQAFLTIQKILIEKEALKR